MDTFKKIIIVLFITLGIALIVAALSVATLPKWLQIPGWLLILISARFKDILDIGSKLLDSVTLLFGDSKKRKENEAFSLAEVKTSQIGQATNTGNGVQINVAGDNNVIQNIAVTIDFLGSLLNASQEVKQRAMKFVNQTGLDEKKISSNIADKRYLDNLQAILETILADFQHTEMANILAELSGILKPIIEKYKVFEREYNFPYGDFCGEFMDGIISSKSIRNAFSTKPLKTIAFSGGLGDHGRTGIKLNTLSKLLPFSTIHKGYYLSANINGFESPDSISKIWFCVLGIDQWERKPRRKRGNIYNSTWITNGEFDRLKFRERSIITEEMCQFDDGKKKYCILDFDPPKFSAFIIGLVSDFILISYTAHNYDRQFNEQMKDLFRRINLEW